VTTDTTGAAPRAELRALEAVEAYIAARERGEHRLLKLPGADLRDIDLSGLQFDECDFTGAVLDGAKFVGASLIRSSLAGASLLGADFSYADLHHADLEAADATAVAFINATLSRANMTRSRLQRADLSEADLSRANLFESNLTGANLSRALASQTNLSGAVLEDAVLTGLRGEPIFDVTSDLENPGELFGWPAARLAEPQLVELAGSYLISLGWEIAQPSSGEDAIVDLIAHRGDTRLVLEVKATATPSHSTFTHMADRLWRAAELHDKSSALLVVPGPIPNGLRELAIAHQIGVLSVWLESDSKSIRVEEAVKPASAAVVCDFPHANEVHATETLKFRFEGKEYEMDLCSAHAKEVRQTLVPYIERARKVGDGGRRRRKASAKRQRSEEIRAWAVQRGLKVSKRGRIPATIVDEYKAAEH
jgi:uncharacterized protein YjbI with pentapeptide repeats